MKKKARTKYIVWKSVPYEGYWLYKFDSLKEAKKFAKAEKGILTKQII